MKNRELFVKDPGVSELVNNGVAAVVDPRTDAERRTLRYELETFVCEKQYARGLDRMLSSFLTNLSKPEQPCAWVSGFYGSGKSHLVKVLRHLWEDFTFPDGATARGLTNLPPEIKEALQELSTQGKRMGGLKGAAGTLGSGAGDSVRLTLLSIVFRSAGLPETYPAARFVIWLRRNGYLEPMKKKIEAAHKVFETELQELYVSPVIAQALLEVHPGFAKNEAEARALLGIQFPNKEDLTDKEMTESIHDALAVDGKLPLTLVVLDEVQQFIGDQGSRTNRVQELTETCCKAFGSRLLFVATGQTALSGTPQLQKLIARFRIGVELSDTDVETVIRKIVLLKRPDRVPDLEKALERDSGEISRHLAGTRLESRTEDREVLAADYPLLPVRRRFWEKTLRAVDTAGTTGQLRTQLRIVHEAVRQTADAPVGTVVAGDFVFDQTSTELVQTGVLLREHDERIRRLRTEGPRGVLKARLCALTFLIGRLDRSAGSDTGVRARADVLADLLVENLAAGSAELRRIVPELLAELAKDAYLMLVEDEYRLQTRESAAWESEFRQRLQRILSDDISFAHARGERLRSEVLTRLTKDSKLLHGKSKVPRKIEPFFGPEAPPIGASIPVWVRDEFNDTESMVVAEVRAYGAESPLVVVFLPKRGADELKQKLAACKAADETLGFKGMPVSPEGLEAKRAMETRREMADGSIKAVMTDIFAGARVFLAGGSEGTGTTLGDTVRQAAADALARLYPSFGMADDPRWEQVPERVRKGAANALEALGYKGDADGHPVCKEVSAFVGAGKKGREIRRHFEAPPFGWSGDTVDGALLCLVAAGQVRASLEGRSPSVKDLDGTKIGVAEFRLEKATVSAQQRLDLRKLFQDAAVACHPGEELTAAPGFVAELRQRATSAGGDPPAPQRPPIAGIDEIARLAGNDLLLALWGAREELRRNAAAWKRAGDEIAKRLPRWNSLRRLLHHVEALDGDIVAEVRPQVDALVAHRSLLSEPDQVPALCDRLAAALRDALTRAYSDYSAQREKQLSTLEALDFWQRLLPAHRDAILEKRQLQGGVAPPIGTEEQLLASLDRQPLRDWATRRDALTQRFADALTDAAKLLEPATVRVALPSATLKTQADLDSWLDGAKKIIGEQLKNGPVIV